MWNHRCNDIEWCDLFYGWSVTYVKWDGTIRLSSSGMIPTEPIELKFLVNVACGCEPNTVSMAEEMPRTWLFSYRDVAITLGWAADGVD